MAVPPNYFKVVEIRSVVTTVVLFYSLACVWLGPALVPEKYFGSLSQLTLTAQANYGTIAKHLLVAIPLVHCCECVVALVRCRQLNIAGSTTVCWLLQTLVFGIGSLRFLLWPIDGTHTKRQ